MTIDSHHHFWSYSAAEYPWIGDSMTALRRDFLPEHLQAEIVAAGIDGVVSVQARQSVRETELLLSLADGNDFIKGVVGWVNLRSPELRGQLEKYSKHPKLVGVRHVVHDEPDDCFMLRPEFRRGIAQLREFSLIRLCFQDECNHAMLPAWQDLYALT